MFFQPLVLRLELADARFGGFEIVDAIPFALEGGGDLGAERPALEHVAPRELVLFDEGNGRLSRSGPLSGMVGGEEAEDAIEPLDITLLNRLPPSLGLGVVPRWL